MEIKYNAFISYRHHPEDIRVATEIHRGLERFKVPKAIRKRSTGITRLFRDKDELPITSSLTDDITRALKNSDYLIVICSVHTKESVWVQREIETFLSTHDRSKVLTVLVNGEPYDVIPEILLHEDVVDPISGEIRRTEIEPLSCDWRVKRSKAIREELPRLAAALLDCGYDELRQRQRQYKTRRLVALFSTALAASLCLAAYFLHTSIQIQKANDELNLANEEIRAANEEISAANEEIRQANEEIQAANVQIQANLDEALRNQSQYLATQSQEHLDKGDRLTAIALALEALPGEDGERPYVPAAEKALGSALSSYVASEQTSAQGAFNAGALVSDFAVTDDGNIIYILDSRETVTVWDTHSFRQLATIDASAYTLNEMYTTPGGNIMLWSRSASWLLMCYGPDGALIWQRDKCIDSAYLNDKSMLMIMTSIYPDIYSSTPDRYILYLDPETGEELRPRLKLTLPDESVNLSGFFEQENSDDRPITVNAYSGYNDYILLLDQADGQLSTLMTLDTSGDNWLVYARCVVSSGDSVIALVSTGEGSSNGNYGTFEVTSPDTSDIYCYDSATGQLKWRSKIIAHTYSIPSINAVPERGIIVCQSSNVFQLHDAATGQIVTTFDTLSIPLDVNVNSDGVWGILDNGSYFAYRYDIGLCFSYPFMDGTLTAAQINGGYFVQSPLGSHVTAYRPVKDETGQVLETDFDVGVDQHLMHGDLLAIFNGATLYLFDTGTQSLICQHKLDTLLPQMAFSQDGGTLWVWDSFSKTLSAIDTANGDITAADIPRQLGDGYTSFDSELLMQDGKILYLLETYDMLELFRYDPITGSTESWPLPTETVSIVDTEKTNQIIGMTTGSIWFRRDDGNVYRLDTGSGEIHTLLQQTAAVTAATPAEDGSRIAMAVDNEIMLITDSGEIIMRSSMDGRKGGSLCLYGDQLLVLCDDGNIYRYDRSGTVLSITALSIYNTFSSKISSNDDPCGIFWRFTGDGDLILGALGAGNIIDCETWQCRAFVPNIVDYVHSTDQLITLSDGQLVFYHRYTTEEQIAKGREALNGFELTAEQKQNYGIE